MTSVRPPHRSAPPAVAGFAFGLAAAVAACTGQTHTLGNSAFRPYHFDPPKIVSELRADLRTDNPTLTADLLEIVFTTERSGSGDVWFARRASVFQPFNPPSPIDEVNTDAFETSAAISADGLTLWFGSDRPGGLGLTDIWMSSRPNRAAPWSTPSANLVTLNTVSEDIPRPPGQHGLVMPLASKAGGITSVYQTFLATRATTGAPFGAPALVEKLAFSDRSTVDAFLSEDGLTLFFSSSPLQVLTDGGPTVDGGGLPTADLFVAPRRSVDEEFGSYLPLDDLNTPGDERDPWLTPDGKTLYFTSDRDGALNIYTAAVRR